MARIAGIDLPKDKRIEIGLTYIYGIGRKSAQDILAQTGINPCLLYTSICGRPHAYLRDYGVCRICFRELAYKGEIPGVRKASF